jgi:glutamate racemase
MAFYNRRMDPRPVGVFDSGVGGLTVLHECLVTMPHEDFVYLGDHARLPYGPRPLEEIARFAREIAGYLEAQGVKLILVACNAATSATLPQLQEELSVPVVGVITPEAHAAVQATRNRRIGLLATEATVEAGRYTQLVRALDAGADLLPVACPRLVPLIESDEPFGAATTEAVREYASPLKAAEVDTVILGCTHYPLIRPIFQRVFGRGVTLVFSAEETARALPAAAPRQGRARGRRRPRGGAGVSAGVEGIGGNRKVPPLSLVGGAEASSEEGGSWGKPGFPHGSEPQARDTA